MNCIAALLVSGPMMKCLLGAGVVLGVTLAAQDARPSASLERPFAANGSVKMNLSAGDYHIVGSTKERVRLEWSIRDADALAKVRASADVRDHEVEITTDGPGNKGLRFTIEVPSRSDLYVRLTAGDLTIEDIRGNKDVELRAGDLNIDVGQAADYKKVDASLWAGDIEASAFQIFKGGLFRSFEWAGSGSYRLHAHLLAGDLHLYSK
jgi:hypothetical protein